jgi:hypothetical protein
VSVERRRTEEGKTNLISEAMGRKAAVPAYENTKFEIALSWWRRSVSENWSG